jgi:hypothetical protein
LNLDFPDLEQPGSLSELEWFGCNGARTVDFSPISRCIFPLCAPKSPESVVALPPFLYRTLHSDRPLACKNHAAMLATVTCEFARAETSGPVRDGGWSRLPRICVTLVSSTHDSALVPLIFVSICSAKRTNVKHGRAV